MRILCFDTSSQALVVALASGGKIAASSLPNPKNEKSTLGFPRHSALLVPEIDKMMRKARWAPESLDFIAVGIGPGSFTGIRVGVATAKILAYVWKKKIMPINSLECFVQRLSGAQDKKTAVMMDARKGKIYGAIFNHDLQKNKKAQKPVLMTREKFLKKAGQAARVVEFGPACPDPSIVSAELFVKAVYQKIGSGELVRAEQLEPLYLHPRDCNVTKFKK